MGIEDILVNILVAISGCIVAALLTVFVAAIAEGIAEKCTTVCPVGGAGFIMMAFINFVFIIIGGIYALFAGYSGLELFWHPSFVAGISFGIMFLLGLICEFFWRD